MVNIRLILTNYSVRIEKQLRRGCLRKKPNTTPTQTLHKPYTTPGQYGPGIALVQSNYILKASLKFFESAGIFLIFGKDFQKCIPVK